MEFIREQKERLRRLEEEEARKDAARAERTLRVKAEQDEAANLVRERKAKDMERQRKEDNAMLKRIELENQKARQKEYEKMMKVSYCACAAKSMLHTRASIPLRPHLIDPTCSSMDPR